MQAKKEQGYKLGKPENLTQSGKEKSARRCRADAVLKDQQVFAHIRLLRKSKKNSWQAIAMALNDGGYKTRQGKKFSAMQAWRIYQRVFA